MTPGTFTLWSGLRKQVNLFTFPGDPGQAGQFAWAACAGYLASTWQIPSTTVQSPVRNSDLEPLT